MDNEIAALKAAIATYGTAFTSLVTGISVGSEDLYRISPTGIAALSGYGAEPATLVSYIGQVRAAIAGTSLSGASIGHVDTWTAWVNGTNTAVINAVDWVGMDAYPYFQNTQANSIANGKGLFYDALGATQAAVGGKEVWITETGWPVTGPTQGQGVPGTAAAKTYWDEVGCPSFGKVNIYWYTLQDAPQASTSPSFGIVGSTLSTTPLYDLSCAAVASSSSTVAPSPSTLASSNIIASASSVISSAIVSSGGGLSPTNGNGVATSIYATTTKATTASSSSPVVTVTATGSPSSSTLTTSVVATTIPSNVTTTRTSGSSSSTTASASTTAFTGAANAVSGSLFGLVGALAAALAAF
jgi:glucan endo-1,3-beta-D-glucosidase